MSEFPCWSPRVLLRLVLPLTWPKLWFVLSSSGITQFGPSVFSQVMLECDMCCFLSNLSRLNKCRGMTRWRRRKVQAPRGCVFLWVTELMCVASLFVSLGSLHNEVVCSAVRSFQRAGLSAFCTRAVRTLPLSLPLLHPSSFPLLFVLA